MKLKATFAIAALVSLFASSAFAAGDAARGQTLYATCGACHGAQGEGMQALNAPSLAGQEEWYVIRQLQNFKNGIRGTNPKDIFGMQMAPMAMTLPTEQAIEDVAAYIKSLAD
ncbi:MAG: c-type cytochrome [Gammaproteobacteria bacterium]|jgi:cytochrome c oxidase subunit 2|nr:c-type cytochrome [Gammaproteobacteria bacterium]MBT6042981.1 c-type cytochrome [Gammaproteobacteria bacterium]